MRNLIYQYYHDYKGNEAHIDIGQPYHELSSRSIRAYAEKCGAEYMFIDKKIDVPFYGIFLPFKEGWCHDYDNICFIDSDILATANAVNIFYRAPANVMAINFMTTDRGLKYRDMLPKLREKGHANSGVVMFPRALYEEWIEYVATYLEHYHATKGEDIRIKDMGDYDQAFINLFMGRTGKYVPLPVSYNYHLGRNDHAKRFDQNLIHYHRKHKSLLMTDFDDDRILK